MTTHTETSPVFPSDALDRRCLMRYPTRAAAVVLRDADVMRLGMPARLIDVSTAGLGIELSVPLPVGEQIKVNVHNEVQRINRQVRGVVRHATVLPTGKFRVGIEFFGRLTPLDVSLLRMGLGSSEDAKTWV